MKVLTKQSFKSVHRQTIDGQALDLVDLVRRFTNGQRLVVNSRPVNLYPADEDDNYIDKSIHDETFENVLPDIDDRVDIEEYVEYLKERKEEIERMKKEREKHEVNQEEKKEETKKDN